jgi:hypothetical protein
MKRIAEETIPLVLTLSEISRTTIQGAEEQEFVKKRVAQSLDFMNLSPLNWLKSSCALISHRSRT